MTAGTQGVAQEQGPPLEHGGFQVPKVTFHLLPIAVAGIHRSGSHLRWDHGRFQYVVPERKTTLPAIRQRIVEP
jgi:hypothetical protein